ncbi:Pkinase-domain-containing protein [Hanseniaspora valbyensis NRRL Y-1626]|uniref:non-specific serine/threonine protein kinase n=1 Tax=Hanseniaspora valbyensis NRRL Y-1626 TaxID=766949 RepID=A0A1B7TFV3_9ASCO|nr:Pkinase-domain-containing protein [Hanseniaspora valbyensis NRRL Y-1626]
MSETSVSKINGNNYIGKYQIIKTLGEGSFGKVKLAYYKQNKVALKIIATNKLKQDDMRGRIDREIQFLRLLRHPHIIKLYDVIKSEEEIIMVMEYASNELFDYIIQREKLPENEGRRFFQQIISAIEYCHRLKIVHRDLKPENLLLDEKLNVKIADFGLSNIMQDGNFLKTSCGSPNYASPEVISGKLYAGPEVDVWSCGVILYVMLCRRLPFDDESIPVLFKNISNGVYTLPQFLSDGAVDLIKKMLIVNPLNRITVDEIFDHEWFKVDLPEYLVPDRLKNKIYPDLNLSDQVSKDNNINADTQNETIVNLLTTKLGYDPLEIQQAFLDNSFTNPRYVEIRDAYNLISKNKDLIHDLKHSTNATNVNKNKNGVNSSQSSVMSASSSNDVPSSFNNDLQKDTSSTISILPSSMPSIHRAQMLQVYQYQIEQHYANIIKKNNIQSDSDLQQLNIEKMNELESIQEKINNLPLKKSSKSIKWHFGIRSRSYPLDVMGEIYSALKSLNCEWAKPSEEDLWTVRVRWVSSVNIGYKYQGDKMKMVIQLFQIEANNYLVDFKFDGVDILSTDEDIIKNHEMLSDEELYTLSAYPFLHMTICLIKELAINSQR